MKTNKGRSSTGFTLIELIIVIGIVAVVIAVAFSMLLFGSRSQKLIQSTIDQQSSFRFIMADLEKTVGNATSIQLETVVPDPVASGFRTIYVETAVDGMNKLVMKEASSLLDIPSSSHRVHGMVAEFSVATNNTMHVKLISNGGYSVEKDIHVQNLASSLGTLSTDTFNILTVGLPPPSP